MYKYANNLGDYGVLIRKAGSSRAPRSITDNAIYRQIEEINKTIKKYESRLEMERDRYIKQFTSLETLISSVISKVIGIFVHNIFHVLRDAVHSNSIAILILCGFLCKQIKSLLPSLTEIMHRLRMHRKKN